MSEPGAAFPGLLPPEGSPPPVGDPMGGRDPGPEPGFWSRLRRHPMAALSLAVLAGVGVTCLLGPWFVPYSVDAVQLDAIRQPVPFNRSLCESVAYLLGFDHGKRRRR